MGTHKKTQTPVINLLCVIHMALLINHMSISINQRSSYFDHDNIVIFIIFHIGNSGKRSSTAYGEEEAVVLEALQDPRGNLLANILARILWGKNLGVKDNSDGTSPDVDPFADQRPRSNDLTSRLFLRDTRGLSGRQSRRGRPLPPRG